MLLFTDGNRTDVGDVDWSQLPPIYPVVPPSRGVAKDVGVSHVSISQTNFESAPVVIRADVSAVGFQGETIVAVVTDEAGKEVERQEAKATGDGKPLELSVPVPPGTEGRELLPGACVRGLGRDEGRAGRRRAATSSEQTLANNSRLVVVDQGAGPTGCST